MDFSDDYISMSKQASEIQEIWRVSYGDWFVEVDDDGEYSISLQDDEQLYLLHIINDIKSKSIWLPSQDQLQSMSGSTCTINLLGIFDDWITSCLEDNVPATIFKKQYENASMEQFWLCFVMCRNYNKVWSEDKQSWVKS